jgi:hypothetical protein
VLLNSTRNNGLFWGIFVCKSVYFKAVVLVVPSDVFSFFSEGTVWLCLFNQCLLVREWCFSAPTLCDQYASPNRGNQAFFEQNLYTVKILIYSTFFINFVVRINTMSFITLALGVILGVCGVVLDYMHCCKYKTLAVWP